MDIYTTVPVPDLHRPAEIFTELEGDGFDGAFTYETRHDPFLPLAAAAGATQRIRLGTALAIAFARNPLLVATVARDLQAMSGGRFVLGLGTQIRPHIERRYSMPWSRPADRMREFVNTVRAIWDTWDGLGPLDVQGEFYTHTLMPPAFAQGPADEPRPPIWIGAVGPRLTAVAAEVGDGILVHPFATRASLTELTLPAVEEGLARCGRERSSFQIVVVVMIATGRTGPELDAAVRAVRSQIAFYGSTPAYAPILERSGWGDLHPQLLALSRQGRWDDMTALIPDEVLESIAVVGRRDAVAAQIKAKVDGLADAVSLECTRNPDPLRFADVCRDLRDLAVDGQRPGCP
jgi:probable F420-dependent oxidoreductase